MLMIPKLEGVKDPHLHSRYYYLEFFYNPEQKPVQYDLLKT